MEETNDDHQSWFLEAPLVRKRTTSLKKVCKILNRINWTFSFHIYQKVMYIACTSFISTSFFVSISNEHFITFSGIQYTSLHIETFVHIIPSGGIPVSNPAMSSMKKQDQSM